MKLLPLSVCVLALLATPAGATTYTVTTTDDLTGMCPAPDNCSLRQAFNSASAAPDADTINVPAGRFFLPNGSLIAVSTDVTVRGAGAGVTTVNGSFVGPVFEFIGPHNMSLSDVRATAGYSSAGAGVLAVGGGTTTLTGVEVSGNLTISGGAGAGVYNANNTMTIRDSVIEDNSALGAGGTGGTGGGIFSASPDPLVIENSLVLGNSATGGNSGGGSGAVGGGIMSLGPIGIYNSEIDENQATGGTATGQGVGGGLYLLNEVDIAGSTIADNVATGGSGGGAGGGIGGGFFSVAAQPVTIENSTIVANRTTKGAATSSFGGGVTNIGADMRIDFSTIANNTTEGPSSGGNIYNVGTATIANSIVSGGVADTDRNCRTIGPLTVQGANIEDANTCGFSLPNTDPKLGGLADNGGPTDTMALNAGSPAIDAATGCPPPSTDQRGVSRPQGKACDLGAYEVPQDIVPPTLSGLSFKPSSFRAASKGASIAAKRKKKKKKKRSAIGSTVSYKLSEAGSVQFTVERSVVGTKKGKTCGKKKRRGKRCTYYSPLTGSFTANGVAGSNSFKFTGRLGGKKLRRGSYRLTGKATDSAGNAGTAVVASFKIVR